MYTHFPVQRNVAKPAEIAPLPHKNELHEMFTKETKTTFASCDCFGLAKVFVQNTLLCQPQRGGEQATIYLS